MELKVGLYNKNFQMASKEIVGERTCDVRGNNARFQIVAGPLIWDGSPLSKTYVLEIRYEDSEKNHREKLDKTPGVSSFSQHLCPDYAEQAHRLAEEFCKEHDLLLNNHLNSWPVYQAVVSKK